MGSDEVRSVNFIKGNMPVGKIKVFCLSLSGLVQGRIDAAALNDVVFVGIGFSMTDEIQGLGNISIHRAANVVFTLDFEGRTYICPA
jgi:hypothetical protein